MGTSSTPKVWGKRSWDADGSSTSTLFRDLSMEQKLKRRREERAEKKERERTLSYFTNTQKILLQQGAQSSGENDGMLAGIVDGFFQELVVLLKADVSSASPSSSSSPFHLLRNGVICQTIELALKHSSLLHCKSLLFLFLGHVMPLITSPVASFVWETLIAGLEQGLSQLVRSEEGMPLIKSNHTTITTNSSSPAFLGPSDLDTERDGDKTFDASNISVMSAFSKEMQDGGQGIHAGSGIPSTATLLSHAVEEVMENMETLLSHEIGARTIRSMILALGGYSIRHLPPPDVRVRFPALLGSLGTSIVNNLERYYAREYSTSDLSETWLAALQVPSTSYLIQSLLRVSEEGCRVDDVCRVHLESIRYRQQHSLLQELLQDATMGWHVYKSYIKVPTSLAVCDEGEKAAQNWPLVDSVMESSKRNSMEKGRGEGEKTPPLEETEGKGEEGEEKEGRGGVKGGKRKATLQSDRKQGVKTALPKERTVSVAYEEPTDALVHHTSDGRVIQGGEEYKTQKRSFLSSSAWGRSLKIMKRVWKNSNAGDDVAELASAHQTNGVFSASSPFPRCFTGEGGIQRARLLLQDLALYSPSATHLYLLWEYIYLPYLEMYWQHPELLGALVAFVRKAALGEQGALALWISSPNHHQSEGRSRHPLSTGTSATQHSKEEEEALRVQKEEGQGVRFFNVPPRMQKSICDAICKSFSTSKKGTTISEFLLFHDHREQADEEPTDDGAGSRGWNSLSTPKENEVSSPYSSRAGADLIRYLLCFHPQASLMMQHSIEKLRIDDLQRAALSDRKCSLVLQQYLHAATMAYSAHPHSTTSSPAENLQPSTSTSFTTSSTPSGVSMRCDSVRHDKAPAARFFRRISPFLRSWAQNKYGGYVIEELFQIGSLALKESMAQTLTPLYHEVAKQQKYYAQVHHKKANLGSETTSAQEANNIIVAKKILQKCSVEQYIYRPEEWRKAAQQQCQAQNLLNKFILLPS